MEHGGLTGWGSPDSFHVELPIVDCRNTGFFHTNDLYCTPEHTYVWRCRNDEQCNNVKPLDGQAAWKMWETWELFPGVANVVVGGFQELTFT